MTGGAGFIGSHIVQALVARGEHVRVLDNLSTGHLANLADFSSQIDFVEGDLTDPDVVANSLEGVGIVFHQAALASVPRSVASPLDTNAACVTGTVTLLDAARRANVRRVVFAGSSSVYGNQAAWVKNEALLPAPLSPYAVAKLACEYYCQSFTSTYNLQTVTLRYFNVFGPRQDPKSQYAAVIPIFISRMIAGERPTIYGDGEQSRDFTFIDNVVHGNLLAAESADAVGRTINVACNTSFSLLELVAEINSCLGTRIEPIFEPPRAGDVRNSRADIQLAQKLIGYEPTVGFKEGLRRTVDYYRQKN